jgi:hypothetical protein
MFVNIFREKRKPEGEFNGSEYIRRPCAEKLPHVKIEK